MTTKEKTTAVIESHNETLKPIYVLLAELSLTRKDFYQCLKDDADLASRYREVQTQVSFIRKRIQIDKMERRLESIAHGRAKGIVTETIRDSEGNIVQVKTIETIKAPSESALRFLLERYGNDAPRKDESYLYENSSTDDEDYDGEDAGYKTIFNVVTRPSRNAWQFVTNTPEIARFCRKTTAYKALRRTIIWGGILVLLFDFIGLNGFLLETFF